MKPPITRQGLFILAFVLVVAVNGIVLSGVAFNRSGTPEAEVILSERELPLPYRRHEENSGLALRLTWRTLGEEDDDRGWRSSPAWLGAEKLQALGFDLRSDGNGDGDRRSAKTPLPRKVLIVLENDGPAYREAVRRAAIALREAEDLVRVNPDNEKIREQFEQAEKHLRRERLTASRLFAVDAGRDPAILRRAYGDRTRFIIARGLVKPTYRYEKNKTRVSGYISGLVVENIHVPLALRERLDDILGAQQSRRTDFAPPRYEVGLAYGRRFEPWVVSVKGLSPE